MCGGANGTARNFVAQGGGGVWVTTTTIAMFSSVLPNFCVKFGPRTEVGWERGSERRIFPTCLHIFIGKIRPKWGRPLRSPPPTGCAPGQDVYYVCENRFLSFLVDIQASKITLGALHLTYTLKWHKGSTNNKEYLGRTNIEVHF